MGYLIPVCFLAFVGSGISVGLRLFCVGVCGIVGLVTAVGPCLP